MRIVRALREAGVLSVAVYSDADRASLVVIAKISQRTIVQPT